MTGRNPKLSVYDVSALRLLRSHGYSADALAELYGIARSSVLRYLRGECRKHREVLPDVRRDHMVKVFLA